ncbi:MAG: tetratricopeptide repeat protein [Cyclobacteriaceae bacterium]
MKKILGLTLALLVCFAGYSQKKPKVNKAKSLMDKGELAEAKEILDAATTHEKTMDDGKMWYYRGLLYVQLDTTSNDAYKMLSNNPMETALKSFEKADELGDEGKEYFYTTSASPFPVTKSEQINNYYSYYYNLGVNEYQESNFREAVDYFDKASFIQPSDTNSVINAAYAAHSGELYDDAKTFYKKAIERGAVNKDYFFNYIAIVGMENDMEKSLTAVNEALEYFPGDVDLTRNRIDLLIKLDRIDEARTELEKAVAEEPGNPDLQFALGVIHDQLGNRDKAIAAYDKAIEANGTHYNSNFNKGVLLLDAANDIIKQQNNLGMTKADKKKYSDLEPVIQQKLKEAMPQWERIVEISPEGDKVQNMEYLVYIYTNLGMKDKASATQKKIQALEQ